MKLTEKQTAVVDYLKANGRVTIDELCNALGTDAKCSQIGRGFVPCPNPA